MITKIPIYIIVTWRKIHVLPELVSDLQGLIIEKLPALGPAE
jgi:hypothetical protein